LDKLACVKVPFALTKGTMYLDHLYEAKENMPWLDFLYKNCDHWDCEDGRADGLMFPDEMVAVVYYFYLTPELETFYHLKYG